MNKRKLIKDGIKLAREELSLQFKESELKIVRNNYYTVYASMKKSLHSALYEEDYPDACKDFKTHFFASRFQKFLDKNYFDTLLYKVHASNPRGLSKHLLNFSPEEIIPVLFHEIFHSCMRKISPRHTIYGEESFAEAFSYFLGIEFSKLDNRLNTDLLIESEYAFENISLFIRQCVDEVEKGKVNDKFYRDSERICRKIMTNLDDYQKQRFDYPFNNAFLLRYKKYCYDYYTNKQQVYKFKPKDISKFINSLYYEDPDF